METGVLQALLESSTAREESRGQLPWAMGTQHSPSSSLPHLEILGQATAGSQGMKGAGRAMGCSVAVTSGEPGTSRPSWHCHPCASGYLVPH